MDFGMQLGSLISGSQQEEKAKYHVVASRIRMTCGLVRSLYGRLSHTKLIENGFGQIVMSSQPGIVYDNIKVSHPLVKLLHEYVKKMDVVGDGSTFFVLLASELVAETMLLIERGVKPALLASSLREIHREIDGMAGDLKMRHVVDFGDRESVSRVLRGVVKDELLERIVVDGICETQGFDSENIRICKVACGSVEDSYVVEGMVFNRAPEGEIRHAAKASTSIYNCPLDISRTELKGTVLMKTADDLLSFSKDENKRIREAVEGLGADVVICSGKVEKVYLDFLNKCGKLVFRVVSKHDLRRIRELVGGHISPVLHPQERDAMGSVDEVSTFAEGGTRYTKFVSSSRRMYTLVLKNSVQAMLDEQERIVQKALTVLDRNCISNTIELVEGAGRFERTLSDMVLKRYGDSVDEKHLAYRCLGRALRVFEVGDAAVLDVYNAKIKGVRYALEFAATLFETSDYLIGKPEALNIAPRSNEHWDEDH